MFVYLVWSAAKSDLYHITFQTGDEMSKRSKFVFCTWVGPNVSVMKKAKMSTDKALMKEIIQVTNHISSLTFHQLKINGVAHFLSA